MTTLVEVPIDDVPLEIIESIEDMSGTKLLKSQMVALENEVLNLRMQNSVLEVDNDELTTSLQKIKETTRNSDDTSEVLKAENQTLKIEIKGNIEATIEQQKEVNKLLAECATIKEELKQAKDKEDKATTLYTNMSNEQSMLIESSKARVKEINQENAQRLGTLKRDHDSYVHNLIQDNNKRAHDLEMELRRHKTETMEKMSEFKETITNQATRITSYEHRINLLDEENNRLRVTQQLNRRNRFSNSEVSEIEVLKDRAKKQGEDIRHLRECLSMVSINSHQDFRANQFLGN